MATKSIEVTSFVTENDVKITFACPGEDFALGTDYQVHDRHILPRINIEGVSLASGAAEVCIYITSQRVLKFKAKALADLVDGDACVTKMFNIDIVSGTDEECNEQAEQILLEQLNWIQL